MASRTYGRRSRRTPGEDERENTDRWLVSYADFITLLFAFFTSMYAISNLDLQKAARLVMATRAAFNLSPSLASGSGPFAGPEAVSDLALIVPPVFPALAPLAAEDAGGSEAYLQSLESRIAESLTASGIAEPIEVHRFGLELTLTLPDRLLFESGSAEIRPEAVPALAALARVLAATGRDVRIEGHTDSLPIETARFPSNWELSTARAAAILRHLAERCGFPAERLAAAGYGPHRPVASNLTAEGRARNRRVEIVVVGAGERAHDAAVTLPAPDRGACGRREQDRAAACAPGDGS